MASDGNTYERSAIEQWLARHDTSPMTNEAGSSFFATSLLSYHCYPHDHRMLSASCQGLALLREET